MKNSILERHRRMYEADSIIIPASILVILGCFQFKEELSTNVILGYPIGAFLLSFVFVLLFALIYLHLSGWLVNRAEYGVIDEIIRLLNFSSPTEKMHEEKLKGKLWFDLRRFIWPLLILFLMIFDILALTTFLI